MADVFVSYARPDEPQAKRVAEALRAHGYQVWRDDEIPAHRPYAEVIEERLKNAGAVVVLWSAEAAKSQWVRAEADAARAAGTLVQATLDGSIPPMPFNQIQCADLKSWDGNPDAPGWRKLSASVAALAGTVGKESVRPRTSTQPISICVLPFANMSGDAEQEYFSDGITEDITTDLSKVSALEVIARNTAFQFKGHSLDVCDLAGKLGVSHVLEGSVRKAAGRVRITAQLIDGATGGHAWADRYDRDLTDIFAIQDEISQAIVAALKVKLLPGEKKALEQRGTSSVDAYSLYLIARKYFTRTYLGAGQQEEKKKIIRICKRAVELDPAYAKAWGLMGWAQAMLFTYDREGDDGLAAAEKAMALDPTVASAHCVIARRFQDEANSREADRSIRHALDLEPEAWEVIREAARTFYNANRFADAVPLFEKALTMVESDYSAWQMLASAYKVLGDQKGVLRAAGKMVSQSQKVLDEDPGNIDALATNACGSAILGDHQRFSERVELALLLDPENFLGRYNFACTSAAFLDDVDSAVELLIPVLECDKAEAFVKFATMDPDLADVRQDPRFQKMFADAQHRLGTHKVEPLIPAAT
jgi:adenylate cyclase